MDYRLDKYIDDLFVHPYEDNKENYLMSLETTEINRYRIKTIKSGKMLESEIYPIWNTSKRRIGENVKVRKQIQDNLNHKNLRKRVVRLINGNFTEEDIWITVGYRNSIEPVSLEAAKKDVVNYIRRLQRYATKMDYPKLKYIYVTEGDGIDTRFHHHIIINFPDRNIAEKKWNKGEYPQARRLKPNDYGLEGLARYISKPLFKKEDNKQENHKKPKKYGYSLNLYKSWQHATIADTRMTKKKAEKLAKYITVDVLMINRELISSFNNLDLFL